MAFLLVGMLRHYCTTALIHFPRTKAITIAIVVLFVPLPSAPLLLASIGARPVPFSFGPRSAVMGSRRMSFLSLKNDIVAAKDDDDDDDDDESNEGNISTEAAPFTRNRNDGSINSQNNEKKLHHWTVCMVPPPSCCSHDDNNNNNNTERVWEQLTHCRTELRDPGLFRWPPHANLLYPFINCFVERTKQEDDTTSSETQMVVVPDSTTSSRVVPPDILEKLLDACRQCEPFTVRLHEFGTFGGKHRGVLWLYPDSRPPRDLSQQPQPQTTPKHDDDDDEPLVRLQSLLVKAFPFCNDQNQKSSGGESSFSPHMTVTHFNSLDEAEAARLYWQARWPCSDDSLTFTVDHIYVLTRNGDNGQFLRVVDVPLGNNNNQKSAIVHDPPIPFPAMPEREPDWVRAERMKLKERRKNNNSSGWKRSNRNRNRPRGPPDTPEVIAAKRAERKAKREVASGDVKRDT